MVLGLHVGLWILMLFRLLDDMLDTFGLSWGALDRMELPEPRWWEYAWLSSLIPVVFSFMAMPKNKDRLMQQGYFGFFIGGLLPLAIGAGTRLPELIDYVQNPKSEYENILGFPSVVLSYMFIAVAIQVEGFAMYFSSQLVKMWRPKETAKKSSAPVQNGEVADHPKKDK